jgi:transcriptional regulator with XRE-family HTH domain
VGRYDPEKLVKLVGERVRELRLSLGWTQNDLAMRLRAAVQRVQNIERGGENLTLFSLARLANALEIEIGDLFGPHEHRVRPRRVGRPPTPTVAAEVGKTGRRKRPH